MELNGLSRKQVLGIISIVAVILGIIVVPPFMQYFYGYSAVRVAFVIIVFYAGVSWYLKRKDF